MKLILTRTQWDGKSVALNAQGESYRIAFARPYPSGEEMLSMIGEASRRISQYYKKNRTNPKRLELTKVGKDITVIFS